MLNSDFTAGTGYSRSPSESMNSDIVFMLCPYLDLGSLFSLTAAYPKWSHIIRKHIEKEKLKVSLTVFCKENTEAVEYSVERTKETMKELPKPLWKYAPFQVLDIYDVYINQTGWSAVSEDFYALLANVTTPRLSLTFRRRDDTRRVLRTISFKPHSYVELSEESIGPDRQPILVRSQMALFERIVYSGAMEMLRNDFLEALDTEVAIVRRKGARHGAHASWLANRIKEYSEANPEQVVCARLNAAEYEIERVPEGGAARSSVGTRTIKVSEGLFRTQPFSRRDGVSFVIENFF